METIARIREIRKELQGLKAREKQLNEEIDSILDLNSGSRAPKRKMLSKEEARVLFRRGA